MGRLKSAAVYTSAFVVCVFAVVVADKFLNVSQCALNDSISVVHKVYVDTITYYKPVPKDSVVVRYLSVTLPVDSRSENCSTDSARLINEVSGTDSVRVVVPVTQTIYEDSAYRAYISGYHARLDSIYVFPRHDMTTFIQPAPKPKRWNIGVTSGYGITPKGILPYIGVGLTYSIFSF